MNGADSEDDDWYFQSIITNDNSNEAVTGQDEQEEEANMVILDTADGLATRLGGETEAEKIDSLTYALRSLNGVETFTDCTGSGDKFAASPHDHIDISTSTLLGAFTTIYSSVYNIISHSPLSDTIHDSFKEFSKQLSISLYAATSIQGSISELREQEFEKEEDLLRMHNHLTLKESQIEMLKEKLEKKEIKVNTSFEEEESSDVAVVLVQIESAAFLRKSAKEDYERAMTLFSTLLGSLLSTHDGRLINKTGTDKGAGSFAILFSDPAIAILFSISLQQQLLDVKWPEQLLRYNSCKYQATSTGTVQWNGLRIRCAADVGPVVEVGDNIFSGPMLQKSSTLLTNISGGSTIISSRLWEVFREKKDHKDDLQQLVASVHAVPFELPDVREKHCWLVSPFSLSDRISSSNDRNGKFADVDYWEAPIQEAAAAATATTAIASPMSNTDSGPLQRIDSAASEPPSVSSFILDNKEGSRLRRIVSRLTKSNKENKGEGLKRHISKRGMSSVAMEKSKEKLMAVRAEVEKAQQDLRETQEKLQWYATELGNIVSELRGDENKRLEALERNLMHIHDDDGLVVTSNTDTEPTDTNARSNRFRIRRRLRMVANLAVRTSENPMFQGSLSFVHSVITTYHTLLKEYLKRGTKSITLDQTLSRFIDSAIKVSNPLYPLPYRERLLCLSKNDTTEEDTANTSLSARTESIISLLVRSLLLFRVMKRSSKPQISADSGNTEKKNPAAKRRSKEGGVSGRRSSRRFSEFGGMEQRQRELQERIRERKEGNLVSATEANKPRGTGVSAALSVRTRGSISQLPQKKVTLGDGEVPRTPESTLIARNNVNANPSGRRRGSSQSITPRRLSPLKTPFNPETLPVSQ